MPKYLIEHGYNVILVNPAITTEILGKKSYPSITDVPDKIDIVDVFRRSEDVPAVIEDANQKKDGIKVIGCNLVFTMKQKGWQNKTVLMLSIIDA